MQPTHVWHLLTPAGAPARKGAAETQQPRKRQDRGEGQGDGAAVAADVRKEARQKAQERGKGRKSSTVEATGEQGVVVQRAAEVVVEFPDEPVKKKKKSGTKGKKGSK